MAFGLLPRHISEIHFSERIIELVHTEAKRPPQNAKVESFHGKLRRFDHLIIPGAELGDG